MGKKRGALLETKNSLQRVGSEYVGLSRHFTMFGGQISGSDISARKENGVETWAPQPVGNKDKGVELNKNPFERVFEGVFWKENQGQMSKRFRFELAPRVGLEPTTERLTAACSTN